VVTGSDSLPRGCYIILHIRPGPPYPDAQTSPQIAADTRFELTEDTWIERLEKGFATRIQKACEPAHYKIDNDVYDRHLYAFVREIPTNETPRKEGLLDLLTVIALSRLIQPTSTGDRYCARVFPHGGTDPPIEGLPLTGVCPDVFVGDNSRDWLSPDDGFELRKLMPWVSINKKMHGRIHRAYWNHEQAMRTYYLDTRWNLVVSGLEALITVEERGVRRQFVNRVRKLAIEFGVDLSETELQSAYTVRSSLAHAQHFLYGLHTVLPPDKHRPVYDKLESLLRATVKKCLLDETFGGHFADNAAVKTKWA
jgi:hypothetical protein